MPDRRDLRLSRRRMFLMAGAGFAARLPMSAATDEFWNKKPPSDWTSQEIDRLITKSPWAKAVKAQYVSGTANSQAGGSHPTGRSGGGYPGGGPGGGYPGGSYPGGGYPSGRGGGG